MAEFGGRARFVAENFGESKLAKQNGVTRYPAIFVNDVLVATPKDFGFFGRGEGEESGRYAPLKSAASHERFRADLSRMITLLLAGRGGEARAAGPALERRRDRRDARLHAHGPGGPARVTRIAGRASRAWSGPPGARPAAARCAGWVNSRSATAIASPWWRLPSSRTRPGVALSRGTAAGRAAGRAPRPGAARSAGRRRCRRPRSRGQQVEQAVEQDLAQHGALPAVALEDLRRPPAPGAARACSPWRRTRSAGWPARSRRGRSCRSRGSARPRPAGRPGPRPASARRRAGARRRPRAARPPAGPRPCGVAARRGWSRRRSHTRPAAPARPASAARRRRDTAPGGPCAGARAERRTAWITDPTFGRGQGAPSLRSRRPAGDEGSDRRHLGRPADGGWILADPSLPSRTVSLRWDERGNIALATLVPRTGGACP